MESEEWVSESSVVVFLTSFLFSFSVVMGEGSATGWSWEENKSFELALAAVDEEDPGRWKEISSLLGGKKSAEEVEKHYSDLVTDLDAIRSGGFDHQLDRSAESDHTTTRCGGC
ncbi:putative clathrin assembly protein [Iris pallida]|uniref:Clathrin assembly protein n=1 Tax=Iris pallida TaxID=29817 RepID=A0AAX6H4D8_IRIPA|nr:putative clathrin assembly protein [Iris pallida]